MSKPPPGVLLAYRFLGWRVGPSHADWVRDDIAGRGWLLRAGAPALAAVLVVGGAITAALGGDPGRVGTVVFVVGAICLFMRTSLRERALRQQGIDLQGDPLKEAPWYADEAARRRRNLQGSIGTVVLVLAGMVVLALRTRP
ncbi:MAG: hypothetical protein JWO12_2461 [Frankiales bacterium]|nr:hypothetical protein [Frankiales bacterium]